MKRDAIAARAGRRNADRGGAARLEPDAVGVAARVALGVPRLLLRACAAAGERSTSGRARRASLHGRSGSAPHTLLTAPEVSPDPRARPRAFAAERPPNGAATIGDVRGQRKEGSLAGGARWVGADALGVLWVRPARASGERAVPRERASADRIPTPTDDK